MKAKIVVIGAGIVGCAVAWRFRKAFPECEVTVLERHPGQFREASRYNSGVIHSGIHQRDDLLKSSLARSGSKLLVEFCAGREVPLRKCGMLIAAASRDLLKLAGEFRSLHRLWKNSRKQNIPIEMVGRWSIREIEPAIRANFGIYLPDIWVVDQRALGEKLREVGEKEGATFCFGEPVLSITPRKGRYELITSKSLYEAEFVINAAGIMADKVAAMARFPRYRIFPYRGEYYEVLGSKKDWIQGLVYPALPPGHPVKGIHFTKTIDGRLLIGPNVKRWDKRDDDFGVQTPPGEFLEAARRFLPDLEDQDLQWAYSGLRAKVNPSVREDDFVISFDSLRPTLVNLIGIESPGFTSALAIAEYIANILKSKGVLV